MQGDSVKKTLLVALGVCLVCSVLVSSAAVALKPKQEENKKLDKLKNILIAGNLYNETTDIEKTYSEKISSAVIDMKTGETLDANNIPEILKPENFDIRKIAVDPEYGTKLSASEDVAGIKNIPAKMNIYQVKENNVTQKYILPVYGKGLWSTMYGFLAIDKDLQTVKGITFYEHGETPGLGGEIDNPRWKQIWVGKKLFGNSGELKLTVIKSVVDPADPEKDYKIDGLSGSTMTTRGVDYMVKFWLGENGYKPFLNKLKGGSNE